MNKPGLRSPDFSHKKTTHWTRGKPGLRSPVFSHKKTTHWTRGSIVPLINIYLTKNGRGAYSIRDIEDEEEFMKVEAMIKLLYELNAGIRS